MSSRRITRLAAQAVVTIVISVLAIFSAGRLPAWAADEGEGGGTGGATTPGLIVTAQNPGGPNRPSDLRITMTAHSELSTVADPSCRPQDTTIACWGSLVLRIPAVGGMEMRGFQVHRVALVTGDGQGGGTEHMGVLASMTTPLKAQVNGISTVVASGSSGLAVGTEVQVKMTLVDRGAGQYSDTISISISTPLGHGGWQQVHVTGTQTIQQVQIHLAES